MWTLSRGSIRDEDLRTASAAEAALVLPSLSRSSHGVMVYLFTYRRGHIDIIKLSPFSLTQGKKKLPVITVLLRVGTNEFEKYCLKLQIKWC